MSEPKTTFEIDREIARLQEKRAVAERDEAIFNALPLPQRVAVVLHGNTCFSDHTEHCGWYYEVKKGVHDFTGGTHLHFLKRAEKTIANMKRVTPLSDDIALALIEAVTARN